MKGMKAAVDLVDADIGRSGRRGRQEADPALRPPDRREGREVPAAQDEDLFGQYIAEDLFDPSDRRDLRRSRRRNRREVARRLWSSTASTSFRLLDIDHVNIGPYIRNTLDGRQELVARGSAVRHLPRDASRRAADHRHGRGDVPLAVLRFRALRPLGRRPREDEHAPRPRRRRHRAHAAQGRHPRGGARARRPARRQGRNRRHRPSRQPPRALGRRAHGEPVSPRPAAHGARHQGAHVLGRHRHGHAAGPDQRQAGRRRRARVLRLLAALAVHGPDEPAVGDHPQAPPVGAWTGRPDARARRLRSARRASDALRPHLPDRDARRPEHRPHQLARHLRARQQVRLHRERLTAACATATSARRSSISRRWKRPSTTSRRRTPRSTRRQLAGRRPRRLPPRRRRHHGPARARRLHGRVAQAARLRRRGAHSVPRERRRQPRAHGLEHAAPGRAAGEGRRAARGHGHGSQSSPATPAPPSPRAAPASSTRSTRPVSSSARRKISTRPSRASTSTG